MNSERYNLEKKQSGFNFESEHFDIDGTEVDSIDVIPENQKDEVPVLVAPGWGATIESFKPSIKVLADKGRRVISLSHPRQGGIVPDLHNIEIEEWYQKRNKEYPDWPTEELRKANTILELLDHKNLDKVDVIAHSEGAINLCIAAMLHPEKFEGRTIILYTPAGLIGKDTFFRLKRGGKENRERPQSISGIPVTITETEQLELMKNVLSDYVKANPLRAFKETLAMAKTQIQDMLRYLHEKGIKIIIIGAVDDAIFPMERLQTNVKADFIDGFLSVSGGHKQLQVHPELYMSAAEKMLAQPEEK